MLMCLPAHVDEAPVTRARRWGAPGEVRVRRSSSLRAGRALGMLRVWRYDVSYRFCKGACARYAPPPRHAAPFHIYFHYLPHTGSIRQHFCVRVPHQ